MKKRMIFLLALMFGISHSNASAQTFDQISAHNFVDGVAVIEAEDAIIRGDWELRADPLASGGAAIFYTGPNRYALDGSEVEASLRYCVMVDEAGDYNFRIRMKRSRVQESTVREDERNDLWLRLSGGQWMKLFANTPWEEYGRDGGLDFHHLTGRRPAATLTFDRVGLNCFELAGRSEKVSLDRLQLSQDKMGGDDALSITKAKNAARIAPVFHPVAVDLTGPAAQETARINPFTDRRLTLNVIAPDGTKRRIRGFFAGDGNAGESGATGGRTWRAIFTPDQVGIWRWTARLTGGPGIAIDLDAGTGETIALDRTAGSVNIIPSLAQAPDWRAPVKGQLTVHDGEYVMAGSNEIWLKSGTNSPENLLGYAGFDGTFRIGGNAREGEAENSGELHSFAGHEKDWRTGDPTWGGGRGKSLVGAVNYLADRGVNSAYFLLWNVGGDGKDVWPFLSPTDPSRFDISKLAQWETLFQHMQQRGIALHLVLQETENELDMDAGDTGAVRKLYLAEMVARFGHHNAVIWNLGEENGPVHWSPEGQSDAQRKAMIDWIELVDPYNHPIVLHTLPNPEDKDEILPQILGFEGLDGLSLQVSDPLAVRAETLRWSKASRDAGHRWALTMDEIGPWNDGAVPDAVTTDGHLALAREALWGHLLAGGAGVEWYFGAQHNHNDLTAEDFRSRDKLWQISFAARRLIEDTFDLATRGACKNLPVERHCLEGFGPDQRRVAVIYMKAGEEVPAALSWASELVFRDPLDADSPTSSSAQSDRIVIARQ